MNNVVRHWEGWWCTGGLAMRHGGVSGPPARVGGPPMAIDEPLSAVGGAPMGGLVDHRPPTDGATQQPII